MGQLVTGGAMDRNGDIEKLISFSGDLALLLNDRKDALRLDHCFEQFSALRFSCNSDLSLLHSFLQNHEKKIEGCKEKIETARAETVSDAEISRIHEELIEHQNIERLLEDDLRAVMEEINGLERERVGVEQRRKKSKKLQQQELREQSKLSLCTSVTNIIPDLGDTVDLSGHIVEREKQFVKSFKFKPDEMQMFDMCNRIWKMVDL